jgi:hypothetical protein
MPACKEDLVPEATARVSTWAVPMRATASSTLPTGSWLPLLAELAARNSFIVRA